MHYQTVTARPVSQAEVMALAKGEVDQIEGFVAERYAQHGVALNPATITRQSEQPYNPDALNGRSSRGVRPVFGVKPSPTLSEPDRMRPDVDAGPIGFHVQLQSKEIFGGETGHYFPIGDGHDTCEATHGANRLFVADPEGEEMRLTPVYGAQVTLSMIVPGLDSEVALERAKAALAAEFTAEGNPDQLRLGNARSRLVKDVRVNVLTFDDKPVAVNVLEAEVGQHMKGGVARVQEVDPSMVVGL